MARHIKGEDFYIDLVEKASDLIQCVDVNANFIYVNNAWKKKLGYTDEEIENLSLWDIIHPNSIKECQEVFQRIFSGEAIDFIEAIFVSKTGKKVYIEGNASCRFDDKGNAVNTRGIFRNITERKKLKEELQRCSNNYKALVENVDEVIYTLDKNMKIEYVSPNVEDMGGYRPQEVIGRNFIDFVHPDDKKEKPEKFLNVIQGKGERTEYRFILKNGEFIWVSTKANPIMQNGEFVGVQGLLHDITDYKQAEERIKYLSYYDALLDVYNRTAFEEKLVALDSEENLPISIIFGDINGLKLTNDIFGHAAGDELLKKSADILRKNCREGDILARVGGDEFAILMPKTTEKETKKIIEKIDKEFSKEKIIAIKGSISIGYDTKTKQEQDIKEIIRNAESKMYKEKALNKKDIGKDMIETIIKTLHKKSPREKIHSVNVSNICGDIGKALKLSDMEIRKVKDAGLMHDIGKITIDKKLLDKKEALTSEDKKIFQEHVVTGFRILNAFEATLDLAEIVLTHHERWDGTGYPKGLKGKEIPLAARIIAVAENYDAVTNKGLGVDIVSKEDALARIRKQAGKKFDPKIVEVFLKIM